MGRWSRPPRERFDGCPSVTRAPQRTTHRRDIEQTKASRTVAAAKTRTRRRQFKLTTQAHASLPCPSGRDPSSVRPQRTRNLMEDWKPWLDITLQKRARRGKKCGKTRRDSRCCFRADRDGVARLGGVGGETGLLLGEKLQSLRGKKIPGRSEYVRGWAGVISARFAERRGRRRGR